MQVSDKKAELETSAANKNDPDSPIQLQDSKLEAEHALELKMRKSQDDLEKVQNEINQVKLEKAQLIEQLRESELNKLLLVQKQKEIEQHKKVIDEMKSQLLLMNEQFAGIKKEVTKSENKMDLIKTRYLDNYDSSLSRLEQIKNNWSGGPPDKALVIPESKKNAFFHYLQNIQIKFEKKERQIALLDKQALQLQEAKTRLEAQANALSKKMDETCGKDINLKGELKEKLTEIENLTHNIHEFQDKISNKKLTIRMLKDASNRMKDDYESKKLELENELKKKENNNKKIEENRGKIKELEEKVRELEQLIKDQGDVLAKKSQEEYENNIELQNLNGKAQEQAFLIASLKKELEKKTLKKLESSQNNTNQNKSETEAITFNDLEDSIQKILRYHVAHIAQEDIA